MKYILLFLVFFILIAGCAQDTPPEPDSPGSLGQATADWYATSADFIVSPQNVEIPTGSTKDVEVTLRNHDFVFSMGYYWDGSKWSSFDLSGQQIGNSLWLQDIGTFTKTLDLQNFPPDTYYFLTYGCKLLPNNAFDCNNDKWLIQEVQVTEKEVISLPQNPSDPNSGVCTTDYAPVCGEDGKTYSNSCVLEQSGVVLAYPGECSTTGGSTASDFKEKPSTYTIGSGKSLEFVPGDDTPANFDVQFQAWSVTQGAIVAAKKDSTAPYTYDASLLDTIPAGKANIQARVRAMDAAGNLISGQATQYDFDIEIVGQQDPTTDVFKDEWEAEAGDLSSDWVVSDGAIDHTGGELLTYADSNPQATYKFSVDKAGVYAVYGLTLAPSNTQDSFFVNVNTMPNQDNIWDVQQTSTFSKNQVRWRNAGLQTFQLDAGTHTLYVTGREQGTKIDKWYVELVGTENLCGNGQLDSGEVCDGGSQTCTSGGLTGTQSCNAACTGYNTCQVTQTQPVCGNGVVETGEECDGGSNCNSQCKYVSSGNECSDGIDNDGDGLVDYGYDLGCYGPNDGSEAALSITQENGWHTWDPHSDTKIIYVSDSMGKDSNPGTINAPVKTLDQAARMVRDNKPDWILLKSGDTWKDQFINFGKLGHKVPGGPSQEYPLLVAAYGVGPRPKIIPPNGPENGITIGVQNDYRKHFAINGLYINGWYRDPEGGGSATSSRPGGDSDYRGISAHLGSGQLQSIVIQDNKLDFFDTNIHLVDQSTQGQAGQPGNLKNADIRRNIIMYAIGDDKHSIGTYLQGTDGNAKVIDNFYYHNGWYQTEAQRTGSKWDSEAVDPRKKEEHNIYGQSWNGRIFAYNNIFAHGATTGIQMRAGGDLICNAFIGNAIAAYIAYKSNDVTHNVVLDASNIVPGTKGANHGPKGDKSLKYWEDARGFGFQIATSTNVQHNWVLSHADHSQYGPPAFEISTGGTFKNNYIYDWDTVEAGPIERPGDSGNWGWFGQNEIKSYSKTIETYSSSIGLDADRYDFYKAVANRPRGEWPEHLSAKNVYKYFSGNSCPIDTRTK